MPHKGDADKLLTETCTKDFLMLMKRIRKTTVFEKK